MHDLEGVVRRPCEARHDPSEAYLLVMSFQERMRWYCGFRLKSQVPIK
jgi:hypothetical protein